MIATLPFFVAAVALLVMPYLLPQAKLDPPSAIALWLSTLALRAVVCVYIAVALLLLLPATQLFRQLTDWCLHGVIPLITTHLGLDGRYLGDTAVGLPALLITTSVISLAFGAWQAAHALQRWLEHSSIGPGPHSSVIVGGSEVMLAAAGLKNPSVVVSAGALLQLDDAELAAGLQHEWGHIVRGHRFLSLFGAAFGAVGRALPGSARALSRLTLHLERDADHYAVAKTGDRMALASVICKSAGSGAGNPVVAGLTTGGVPERLLQLTGEERLNRVGGARLTARLLAAVTFAATVSLAVGVIAITQGGVVPAALSLASFVPGCS